MDQGLTKGGLRGWERSSTHYGRICPVETPEGPNIGLISSLSIYGRVNDYGFIETPYRLIESGKVTDDVKYCSALEEANLSIAQANAALDAKGHFKNPQVQARRHGEYVLADKNDVKLMDVSPQQLVSVAAARSFHFWSMTMPTGALMGANMQRQAVPLLRTESPLVGTGVRLLSPLTQALPS